MKRVQLSPEHIVEVNDELYEKLLAKSQYGNAEACPLCHPGTIGYGCEICIIPRHPELGDGTIQCIDWLKEADINIDNPEAVRRFILERTL